MRIWPAFGVMLMVGSAAAEESAAEKTPDPKRQRCLPYYEDVAEEPPEGLNYNQVQGALNKVIQYALYCDQPKGMSAVAMTFELSVGCDGLVKKIETIDDGGAPLDYVSCVSSVISKAGFPGHEMESGFPVTYPVNVSW